MPQFISQNEKETIKFAQQFAESLRPVVKRGSTTGLRGGEVVLLFGDLGSGKTTFVKGLAAAFGIKEKITSPTFVLMHQHKIRNFVNSQFRNFIHIDTYRLKTAQELLDIGLSDWLSRTDTVVLIEWGEKIRPWLRRQKIKFQTIKFKHGRDENERIIEISHLVIPAKTGIQKSILTGFLRPQE